MKNTTSKFLIFADPSIIEIQDLRSSLEKLTISYEIVLVNSGGRDINGAFRVCDMVNQNVEEEKESCARCYVKPLDKRTRIVLSQLRAIPRR